MQTIVRGRRLRVQPQTPRHSQGPANGVQVDKRFQLQVLNSMTVWHPSNFLQNSKRLNIEKVMHQCYENRIEVHRKQFQVNSQLRCFPHLTCIASSYQLSLYKKSRHQHHEQRKAVDTEVTVCIWSRNSNTT
jgi:hypothetical protein